MDCGTARESLSAQLDGEPAPVTRHALDRHLESCASCQTWQRQATELARRMRLSTAPAVADRTAELVRQADLPARPRWTVTRTVLAAVAVAQVLLGAAQILGMFSGMHGGHGSGAMTVHLGNEGAAWNVALGVGMLWAALYPRTATAQLPAFTGFILVLATVSATDVLAGRVTADRLLTHVLVVVGVLLLWAVSRHQRHPVLPGPLSTAGSPVTTSTAGTGGSVQERARRRSPEQATGQQRTA